MGADAAVPPGLLERVRQIVTDELGKLLRSGLLRNASISEGGLTIKGGFLRLLASVTGTTLFYVGPYGPSGPDGTPQQGMYVRRADGTAVLAMFDAFPDTDGGLFNQALNWYGRTGGVVFSDDTDSGQGIARPYLPGVFYRSRNQDWPTADDTSWTTVYRARMVKQQPRLLVQAWAVATEGGTGEMRVVVNGVELAPPVTVSGSLVAEYTFGPTPVDGAHMAALTVELQVRMVSGPGGVQSSPSRLEGRQS